MPDIQSVELVRLSTLQYLTRCKPSKHSPADTQCWFAVHICVIVDTLDFAIVNIMGPSGEIIGIAVGEQ